mmetsp:Transcript_1230/g.2384  ORF Transcript_1230/g.2384 Transcript_1230/m.2384 type:complete len:93 (+) Transcript_1230:2068-2346(+)
MVRLRKLSKQLASWTPPRVQVVCTARQEAEMSGEGDGGGRGWCRQEQEERREALSFLSSLCLSSRSLAGVEAAAARLSGRGRSAAGSGVVRE